MKKIIFSLSSFIFLLILLPSCNNRPEKPNVILIMTDDQGYGDIGAHGNPWVKTPVQEIRKIVKPNIPIRRYPDITHSLSSQYPIPKWDLAYAITLGRECINPRPVDEKMIHNAFDEHISPGVYLPLNRSGSNAHIALRISIH